MATQFTIQDTALPGTFKVTAVTDEWRENLGHRCQAGTVSQDTANTYRRGMDKFIAWLGDRPVHSETILDWLAYLRNNGNRPGAINAWYNGVKDFFKWAAARNYTANPTLGVPGARRSGTKKRHIREALDDAEVIRLLRQPDRSTPEGKRDYALLAIQLYTAARGIELYRADVADLETQGGRLVLMVQGKGQNEKNETLILVSEAAEAVRDWLGVHPNKDGALFVSLSARSKGERLSRSATREILKRYFNAAGIVGNKSTHSLRHTAITNALRHGVPITRVSKQLARHASIDTTMVYVHETDRLTDPVEDHIYYDEKDS